MSSPLVSVVIPNYNYGRYLGEAIESVLAQTHSPIEIIVVDDGSNDNSDEVIKSFGCRIRAIRQKNAGVSAARNEGASHSLGEWLAFLDADDWWRPEKISRQLARASARPKAELIHTAVEVLDEHGYSRELQLEGAEGRVASEMLLLRKLPILAGGSGLLLTRSLFCRIGGFDTRLSTSADWDLCYRAALASEVAFVPEPDVCVRSHGGSMQTNVSRMEHDMLIGFSKAFQNAPPELVALRREAYANLHMILAGSFLHSRQRGRCLYHLCASLIRSPRRITRVFGAPVRWWRRVGARTAA